MKKFIIYGLFCPFTDNLHYIGKSTSYMTRPQQHLTKSHSDKINEWVAHLKTFGYTPIIKILTDCDDENELRSLESQYISNSIKDGCYLLNEQQNSTTHIMSQRKPQLNDSYILDKNTTLFELGEYLRIIRISANLTQQQLSEKCGVSVGTIKHISKNTSIRIVGNQKAL
jgi:DNA-binding transcriptional regulator YiaG